MKKQPTDEDAKRKSVEIDEALGVLKRHVPHAANILDVVGFVSVADDAEAAEAAKELNTFVKKFWKTHRLPDLRVGKQPTEVAWAILDSLVNYLSEERVDSREPEKPLPRPTRGDVARLLAFEIRAAFPSWDKSDFADRIYERMPLDRTRSTDRTKSHAQDDFNEDPKKTIIAAFKAAGLLAERADKLFHAEVVKLNSGKK